MFAQKILTIAVLTLLLLPVVISAQSLDSTNYTLIEPSLGAPISGVVDSANFRQLYDSTVGSYTTTSTTYEAAGGLHTFITANVPIVSCLETDTDNGSTQCAGLPGSDGMAAVCSTLGCYDRMKIEIDQQLNADDVRYAIQISTVSDFSSNVGYINPTTRYIDSIALDETYFVPKCEWEGTAVTGVCGSPNATYQAYNIFGLAPDTTYYVRLSAHHGLDDDGYISQSDWSPTESARTAEPQLAVDVDIAPDTVTPTAPPYILDAGISPAAQINTPVDMIVFKLSTNALSGLETQLSGLNGGLQHTSLADIINSVNADLAGATSGYGLRNEDTTNSADNSATIGDINVSGTPSDFTDTGAAEKVGEIPTSSVPLLNSGGLPLDNGIAGFQVKIKPSVSHASGSYQEVITFYVFGTF